MPGGSAANVMKGLANLLPRSELQARWGRHTLQSPDQGHPLAPAGAVSQCASLVGAPHWWGEPVRLTGGVTWALPCRQCSTGPAGWPLGCPARDQDDGQQAGSGSGAGEVKKAESGVE
eukprot:328062-Chlamydomonas_euryale.AAC.4